ncbi:MAG: sigma-54 interaction domain-containing protein [Phycisphaerales bacterium JB038]
MKHQCAKPLICETVMDSIAAGIFTIDRQCRITFFNREAERVTGYGREEALGEVLNDIIRASHSIDDCPLRRTLETGETIMGHLTYLLHRNGRRVPIRVTTGPLRDEAGETIGAIETFQDLSRVEELQKRLEAKYTFEDIIGRSAAMQRLFELLPVVAESESTILIGGASGTGKELAARAIHNLSPRREKKFVVVNCGALPDTLLESELFGYKKGAFTDARSDKPGRFAVAEGGTIFLDEIGDISPAMQSRLLRVLQERIYEPLGSVAPVRTNVRVVAASNRDLRRLVKAGTFRQDLFYRINVIRIELPPLSERREDVPLLIEHFLHRFNRLYERDVPGLSDEAMAVLLQHDYPGNVRELENVIEHAFVLCQGHLIERRHLPPWLADNDGRAAAPTLGALTLKQYERLAIADAIRRHGGNRHAAANALGIHPSTLFRKVKVLGIDLPEEDGRNQRAAAHAAS